MTGNYGKSRPTLTEYLSDAGEPNGVGYQGVVSDWDLATYEPACEVEWTTEVEDDSDLEDGMDVSMSVPAYASLLVRARAHCPGCSGSCGR